MDKWIEATVGDVLTLQRGFDITRDQQQPGIVPVVSSGGIASFHDTAMVQGPGVVIGRKGTLGTVFFLDVPYWPHDTTLWVKDFKGSWPRFVYYFMKQLDVAFLDVGSANPTLNRNHVHPLRVSWPPATEQQAIAEVLGALDDKIAANTMLTEAATELAIALLAGHSPSVALADVVVQQKKSIAPVDFGDGRVAHFSLPAFDAGQQPHMTSAEQIKSSKFAIERPCVLVSKLNPRFPRIWDVVQLPIALAVSSTEFLVLESDCCASTVLWAILSQPSFSAELESKVAGTSGSHQRVRPDDLLATHVVDPRSLSLETMNQIEPLGRHIAVSREESTSLAQLRDALLPLLMSGKIRVKDAEQMVGDVV